GHHRPSSCCPRRRLETATACRESAGRVGDYCLFPTPNGAGRGRGTQEGRPRPAHSASRRL
ncbi:MAG: hypothetical protein AVDCRST_MAG59-5030, partial [uncultured Thermomicrobiales bacterium]